MKLPQLCALLVVAMSLISCNKSGSKSDNSDDGPEEKANNSKDCKDPDPANRPPGCEPPPPVKDDKPVVQAPGKLLLNLDGAVGLAVTEVQAGLNLTGEAESNLKTVSATGTLTEAFKEGKALVKNMMIAPSGKTYLVFQSSVTFTEEEDNGMNLVAGEEAEDENVKTCLLAEVDDKGKVTCVDEELKSVNWNLPSGPIQFAGNAVYYSGLSNDDKTVLRRAEGAEIKNLVSDNVTLHDYKISADDAYIAGKTTSSSANWLRKVNAAGALSTISGYEVSFMHKMPGDGNLYFATSEGGFLGVQRYITATSQLDANFWIGIGGAGSTPNFDVTADPGYPGSEDFISTRGSMVEEFASTSDGKTYARITNSGEVVEYFPTVQRVALTNVKKASLLRSITTTLIVAGTNNSGAHKLVSYNTSNATETDLIPDEEIEIYEIGFRSADNFLLASGLRFSSNRPCIVQINLASGEVSVSETDVKLSTLQGF